jgi:hypothetical protein
MQISLPENDLELLREVLDSAVDGLRSEIAHTDNRVYRQNLKNRRDRLRGLIEALGRQPQPQPHGQTG